MYGGSLFNSNSRFPLCGNCRIIAGTDLIVLRIQTLCLSGIVNFPGVNIGLLNRIGVLKGPRPKRSQCK